MVARSARLKVAAGGSAEITEAQLTAKRQDRLGNLPLYVPANTRGYFRHPACWKYKVSTATHRRRCLHRPEPIYVCRLRSMAQLGAKDKDRTSDDGHAVGHLRMAPG